MEKGGKLFQSRWWSQPDCNLAGIPSPVLLQLCSKFALFQPTISVCQETDAPIFNSFHRVWITSRKKYFETWGTYCKRLLGDKNLTTLFFSCFDQRENFSAIEMLVQQDSIGKPSMATIHSVHFSLGFTWLSGLSWYYFVCFFNYTTPWQHSAMAQGWLAKWKRF